MHVTTPGLALFLTAGLLLAGCAGTPDMTGRQTPGIGRQGPVDNALVRSLPVGETDDEYAEASEARARELEAALNQLESDSAERTPGRAPLVVGTPRSRIAVVLDTPLQERMSQIFAGVSLDYPVLLLNDAVSRTALANAGCSADTVLQCADQLRRKPGIRMLIAVHDEGDNRVTVRFHDLELDETHTSATLALPETADGRIPDRALESLADKVLISSLDHARAAPWLARTLSRENTGWAINAGEASGLDTGDQLRVHRAGRIIHGPRGRVAGWISGEPVGTVRISALSGADNALVTLVDGQAPAADDVLIPMRR